MSDLPIWKHYSSWVAALAALIYASPVDLMSFDFTTLDANKTIRAAVFIVLFFAAKAAKQDAPAKSDAPTQQKPPQGGDGA